jgi:ABC-type dipeptide/oligopeptide/nickel transport system permease component
MTIPVLLGVLLLTFSMLHLVPGDPVRAMFIDSGGASEEQIEQVRRLLGLDKPLPVQFWNYLVGVLQGDLGRSIITNQEVSVQIAKTFPSTLVLTAAAMTLAIILGFSFGIISAVKRGTWIDSAMMVFSLSGVSIPSFWLGLLMIYFFSVNLRLIPIVGGPAWKQLIMPAVALGLPASAIIARLVRTSMLEVLSEPYVTTARAKGLGERIVLFGHALRNALLPVSTIVGLQFGALLSGAVIVEAVFARQGIGRVLVEALQARDFPVAQGTVLFIAMIYVLVNLGVDLVYGLIDPRIRTSS